MDQLEFQGFSPKTQEFLWSIRLNNNRDWFLAHKEEYQAHVAEPMARLGRQVHGVMAGQLPQLQLHVSRIYRDARRLHGRGPYKDHMWFTLHRPVDGDSLSSAPVFYFEIAPEGCSMGMGCYDAGALTMAKLRARIDREPKPLEELSRRLARQRDYVLEGELYKRPKGDPGALLAPWYNRRNLSIGRNLSWEGEVFTPGLVNIVAEGFGFLMPYYGYLMQLSSDPDPRYPD